MTIDQQAADIARRNLDAALFGIAPGNTLHDLITEQSDRFPAALEWARANGFTGLYISILDGSIPDFTKAIGRP